MTIDPKEIFGKRNDTDWLQEFIASSKTAVTAEMNQSRVASEVLLSKTMADSMTEHAQALQESATASAKHAQSLTRATWALVLATIALVLMTAVQWWR